MMGGGSDNPAAGSGGAAIDRHVDHEIVGRFRGQGKREEGIVTEGSGFDTVNSMNSSGAFDSVSSIAHVPCASAPSRIIATTEQHNQEFKILTYNFWIRPFMISLLLNEKPMERISIFEETELKNWDVILFQEVFSDPIGSRAIKRWKEEFGLHIYSMPLSNMQIMKNCAVMDGGISIVSQHKLHECDFTVFKDSSLVGLECLSMKGVIYAIIYPGDGKTGMHLFNTHLHSNYLADGSSESGHDIRRAQMKNVLEFMRLKVLAHPDPKVRSFPVLLAGDFNVNANPDDSAFHSAVPGTNHTQEYVTLIEELTTFTGKRPHDILYERYGRHVSTFLEDNDEATHRLDYLFMFDGQDTIDQNEEVYDLRGSEAVCEIHYFPCTKVAAQSTLSDHAGVSASFPFIQRR